MDPALTTLIAAAVTFVGSHFALSHPLRAPTVRMVGSAGFQAVYSLVALASFAWLVMAFRAVPVGAPLWDGAAWLPWLVASLLTLIAAILLVGSFAGNPALPAPGAAAAAVRAPHGVFLVTRHPMMWGFALWAAAHALIAPTARTLALVGAIALLALLGAHFQDGKKRGQMGAAWIGWQAQTSYWPRLGALGRAGAVPLGGGLVLWLAATWMHIPAIGVPAGVWRWLI